ncbi:MAG: pseudouridine synthase [Pseudomonadota bacterium]
MRKTPPSAATQSGEKLQKVLAEQGLASRREIERWISAGRIRVNDEPAHLGQRVMATDKIEVDGQKIAQARNQGTQVLILNKAAGTVCARHDPEGRKTVFEGLPHLDHGRWISVGRLDFNTTGLLLLTNSGALANKLMHPSTGLDREYAVRINGKLEDHDISALKEGIEVEDEFLNFSDVRYYDGSGANHWYHVVLMEGKNREVRRLFEARDYPVSRLKRVRYGPVILPSWLRNGHWAVLRDEDVKTLCRLLGLAFESGARRKRRSKLAKTTCLLPYPKLAS